MPKFKVYVTVYHRIDVEASNKGEAEELAKNEIWDDISNSLNKYIKDVIIDVEGVEADGQS